MARELISFRMEINIQGIINKENLKVKVCTLGEMAVFMKEHLNKV